MAELSGNQRASSGSDITLSCSDGSSDPNSPREFGAQGGDDMFLDTKDASVARSKTGWGWPLAATRGSSAEVEKLRSDLIVLARKAENAELELQTLRKQIVKETKRGQDLCKERDGYKEECEKLRASHKHKDEMKARNKSSYEGNLSALLEEARQELNHEKNLNANLRLQLQKTQDSNSELILAVQDLEQMLEQCNREGQKIDDDDDEEQKALEELVKQHSDVKEAHLLEQKITGLCSEIEMHRRDKDELEMQMEQLALDYEILKQENHDMSCKLEQSHLRQQLKLQYECSGSYATIHELENQVEKLESELDDCSNELSDSLATLKELENHCHSLEDELEKQAQEFKAEMEALIGAKVDQEKQAIRVKEALENRIEMLGSELKKQSEEFSHALETIKELEGKILGLEKERGIESGVEAITRAKVEQEQRALRAEEALRLTRWKNANMAGRLQDEFKRLEAQMQSTFEENGKVATKAMTEASHLRAMNNQLEELLKHAREELQSVKEAYEAQVSDLRTEMNLKSSEMDQMLAEAEEKYNQLDAQRENDNEVCRNQSAELLMLRAEVDRLKSATVSLSAQIEQMEELRAELEQAKEVVKEQKSLLQRTERERDNLESLVDSARKEIENLRCLKDESDMALKNLQSEMENLRAQCEELRHSTSEDESEKKKLRKQVYQLNTELNKKDGILANMERKLKESNGRVMAAERTKGSSKNSKAEPPFSGSKEAASLREKIKLLEEHIKQKEAAMDTSATAFLEREKDLNNKIEELERRLQEFNQNSMVYFKDDHRKVDGNGEELEFHAKPHNLTENGNEALANTNGEEASTINSRDDEKHDIEALFNEMASLREKNSSMETELKEMQERYSEISLKFAEVEGERQQLVMTLRNVKNATRS